MVDGAVVAVIGRTEVEDTDAGVPQPCNVPVLAFASNGTTNSPPSSKSMTCCSIMCPGERHLRYIEIVVETFHPLLEIGLCEGAADAAEQSDEEG
jgi:hypothetical protein